MLAVAELAQDRSLEEFAREPILTVACVLLIVVSAGWIVVTRLIARNLKSAELKRKVPLSARKPRRLPGFKGPYPSTALDKRAGLFTCVALILSGRWRVVKGLRGGSHLGRQEEW